MQISQPGYNDSVNELSKNGVVNVKDSGGKGDGVTDDWQAIDDAVQLLKSRNAGKLLFPPGSYRIGRGSGRLAGLYFADMSNVIVEFSAGAELLMDNLNTSTNLGDQAHGILVSGNSSNITFVNPCVRWKTKAAARSTGDGMRFLGSIDPNTCVRDIKVINPYVEKSPQAGIIFMGCKDVTVENPKLYDTWADGVHINACHDGVNVKNATGINTGDDVVAIVTYYHPTDPGTGPFNSPDITTRNNNGTIITGVKAKGGSANAVRISGAYNVQVSNVNAVSKTRGVIIDSAIANGTTVGWTYLASKKVQVHSVNAISCSTGVHVETFNCTFADGDNFTLFEEVLIDGVVVSDCTTDNVYVTDCKGITLRNVESKNGRVRVIGLRNGVVENIHETGGNVMIYGSDVAYTAPYETNVPWHGVKIEGITIDAGNCAMQDLRGAQIGTIKVTNSSLDAITMTRVFDANINALDIQYPNRSASTGTVRALLLTLCRRINIMRYVLEHDANALRSLELGGGASGEVTKDIRIRDIVYRNTKNQTTPDVTIQGGADGPTNWYVNMAYWNGGEATPKSRYYTRKEEPNGATTERPSNPSACMPFFDTTLNKPIWRNATNTGWIDSSGNAV